MQREKARRAINLAFELENTVQLCILLKKTVPRANTTSTVGKVKTKDIDVYNKVRSDLESLVWSDRRVAVVNLVLVLMALVPRFSPTARIDYFYTSKIPLYSSFLVNSTADRCSVW